MGLNLYELSTKYKFERNDDGDNDDDDEEKKKSKVNETIFRKRIQTTET